MNWEPIEKAHPRLAVLRQHRFDSPRNELERNVECLFEPLSYPVSNPLQTGPLDLAQFSASSAWESYWSTTAQDQVDALLATWVPILEITRILGQV